MKLKEQKEIILKDFDFCKVEKVMTALDWKWVMGGIPGNIEYRPNISQLKNVANTCLDLVIESDQNEDTCSMGGFEAIKLNGMLELRFVIDKANPLESLMG
jgi:hypothetical protein